MPYLDIISLQNTTGTNAKRKFIEDHATDEWFKKFLYYALNPTITYNLSETTLVDMSHIIIPDDVKLTVFSNDIFDCCECLSKLRGIDDATLQQVCLFLYKYTDPDARGIYVKLLAKTIRLGVTAKTVNKIIPGLIPEWDVQQSYPIDKYPLDNGVEFWLTQKLNGVRATLYNGKLIARSGVPYTGLDHIINILEWATDSGYVLDGELTLKDTNGMNDNEAFRIATGILNSDEVNKTCICYTIFDLIPIDDFNSDNPQINYKDRRVMMEEMGTMLNTEYTRLLPVLYHGTDQRIIDPLLDRMVREDKEGLILNTNCPYKRTRHKGILKIKRFYTMDLMIIGCEEGTGRLCGTLGALILDYKGNEVRVGSGFSDEQRDSFWIQKENIVSGEYLCEVKYKDISRDKKTNLESLQFPVFVGLRKDKSNISYW